MDLAKRDIGIQHLKTLIKQKKDMLNNTKNNLHKNSKDNIYLKYITEEYTNDISLENKKLHNAFQLLHEYLIQITLDPTSTEEMLRNCKYDLSIILDEIKKLKN